MKKKMRPLSHLLEYLLFLAGYSFVCYVPFSSKSIPLLAHIAYTLGIRKKVVQKNLKRVYGEEFHDENLVKKIYHHAAHVLWDFLRLDHKPLSYTVQNPAVFENIRKSETPVIGISCHLGNWEIFPRVFIEQDIPFTAIAKPIHNPHINRFIEKKRLSSGVHIVYTKKRGLVRLTGPLKQNHTIGFLLDQNAGKRGMKVPFLGFPASTFTGPALLCVRRNIPFFFAYSVRKEDGTYEVILEDLVYPEALSDNKSDAKAAVEDILRLMNQKISAAVRKHPEQWFWFHRRWNN